MIDKKGFTLIELLITILVFSVIISAVYASNTSQQKTYRAQDQVADIQQTLRAAMTVLISDIRMAGYNPMGNNPASLGVTVALPGQITIGSDLDGNGIVVGDPGEFFAIGFPDAVDVNNDGIPDGGGVGTLGRNYNSGGYKALAENIQAIEFRYFDEDGLLTVAPGSVETIQLTILARANAPDINFTDIKTYTTPSGQIWGPYNDNFRRRLATTTIRCRNL